MIREKIVMYPTIKATEDGKDTDAYVLPEGEFMTGIVLEIKDIATQYGQKTLMTLEVAEKKYNCFVNSLNINALIDAYGNDDIVYIGKEIMLSIDKDKKFNKKYIKFTPK